MDAHPSLHLVRGASLHQAVDPPVTFLRGEFEAAMTSAVLRDLEAAAKLKSLPGLKCSSDATFLATLVGCLQLSPPNWFAHSDGLVYLQLRHCRGDCAPQH